MPPHPLHNIVQVIHVDESKLLFTSTIDDRGTWIIHLFAKGDNGLISWTAASPEVTDSDALATAARGGYLHVRSDEPVLSSSANAVTLDFILPHDSTVSHTLTAAPASADLVLLNAAFTLLEPPSGTTQASEMRSLRAQLTQKDNEISSLNAKLSSARASVVRSTAVDKKGTSLSPQKKVPANASALQPNQKRRKAIEEEFAGSSDEDDD
ncbi:hypothetical protein BD324DRAFT_276364 [Kockovaella imperatae]|uniref:Uncharacterized protein n=1 Tax=Kockovaella imperatae TaxID=4999 RepID=A0A1Y1U7M6_9TREE|nr:hypothetical protein BD324DRAFT_276364 [Kockovaella imperatae]ORX33507.1 hypothetical protein BD324DRAFT_276364 [Kockovaella imperatae]